MATTVKNVRKGVFRIEQGATEVAWGTGGVDFTSDVDNLFPYLTLGAKKKVGHVTDDSIVGLAFSPTPNLVSGYVEDSLSAMAKYERQLDFLTWAFGFNSIPVKAVCFVLSAGTPVVGDTYTTDSKTFTFKRTEANRAGTLYTFTPTTVAPTTATGTLTRTGGTGSATCTYTAVSVLMYERVYELDAKNRHVVAPAAAAYTHQAALGIEGYTGLSTRYKNRRASMAVANGPADVLMINTMCKKFGLGSSAGDYAKWAADFCGYSQTRGSYGSANWIPQSADIMNADLDLLHHQLEFSVGTAEGSMVDLGVTDFSFDVGIPLQVQQDCISGTYMQEPVMEGKYDIKVSATLSRHANDVYQAYRDAWTEVLVRAKYVSGYRLISFMFGSNKISDAGPDDGGVAKEPLVFTPGWQATKPFPLALTGALYQGSPINVLVRDTNALNPLIGE
jgi:hypothetical protein